jgi:phosphoribosylanthranilate isomerase
MLQLHGSETPQRVAAIRARFGRPVMKAIGVSQASDLGQARAYADVADHLLFDAKPTPGSLPGGNGLAFDWRVLAELDPARGFMLSGGLNPSNVAQAIAVARPWAVDVSSGVERSPGEKDPQAILAFVRAARAAAAQKEAVA